MQKETHHFSQMEKKVSLSYTSITELAANLFIVTQTEEKLKRDNIGHKLQAIKTHFKIGTKVYQTIEELGGTVPEHLTKPEKNPQLAKTQKKLDVNK